MVGGRAVEFSGEAAALAGTPLRFPGKILADAAGNRLFIADSNHNRIVVADLAGKLEYVIGDGRTGRADGDFAKCSFDHPQGMALRGDTLYIADTENHLLRKVDLTARQVTSIAGVGTIGREGWPGIEQVRRGAFGEPENVPDRWVGPPMKTALNSPWDLWIHDSDLFIAMAGRHQIWKMTLDEREIGPYAGNGREDIVDGPLLSRLPYQLGFASFAQPSGLASDGKTLFVADSEGSSVRAVPLDGEGEATTIVGLPGSLFDFGDIDGEGEKVRLQHALGVAYDAGLLYVADTYNNKIKVVDPAKRTCRTFLGDGQPGRNDEPPRFDEPAGISVAAGKLYVADTNNHALRVVDLATKRVSTLTIAGLAPPKPATSTADDPFATARQEQVAPTSVRPRNGQLAISVRLKLPDGWKVNPLAPQYYQVALAGAAGPIDRKGVGQRQRIDKPTDRLEFSLPLTATSGQESLRLLVQYYSCREGAEGLCQMDQVVLTMPLTLAADAASDALELSVEIP